ncbi:acyltransferase family protein [Mucilaginibacter terrae]|uniref:Peptidoglycan/LPS O-acetylase OafA/YrhL n=1 Tax=Mucilaginibacter terrae TaxID=1955052 RepID=A0ABU3GWU1_9SPHI|nr:acyltransferase family protein [Mucilaginibacter terrae]MDT3404140.1 peptidoglycan/LPS O-acetylase OafA/YrhL [Mucilaginibacter terrae]
MANPVNTIKDFRYDINALRAIAIIGVLFFHYKVSYFDGGFAGVDVFFVISGYLMTRIIVKGLDKGGFSFADFYGKRLKRILPALLFLILLLTVACFFIYFPGDYRTAQRNAAASLLFVSNILYWKTTNYFATASDDNILLHTWSLSAEWQFYLLYPVLLLVLYKVVRNKKLHLPVFILVTLGLYVMAVKWSHRDQTSAFYLLPTRSWEMLFGGIAFLAQDYVKAFKARWLLALAGYAAIIFCYLTYKSGMFWPGTKTMVPVLATFLIIVANCDFKVLRFSAVQFIGKISYSLYLWHWPVFVIGQYLGFDLTPVSVIVYTLIAVVCGYISYRLVETRNYNSNPQILTAAFTLLIFTGCFAYLPANNIVFKNSTVNIANYKDMQNESKSKHDGPHCWISRNVNDFDKGECLAIIPQKKNFLLIGDSHAAQFAGVFREEFKKRNINLMQATASGCFAIKRPNGEARCRELMAYVYDDFIKNNSTKIDGVIICGNWVSGYKTRTDLVNDLKNTLAHLQKSNVPAVIIGQNETYKMTYPYILARENEYNVSISKKYLTPESVEINKYLKSNLKDSYIDVYNYGQTPKPVNDVPYMSDRNHLSTHGARLAMNKILANPAFVNMLN